MDWVLAHWGMDINPFFILNRRVMGIFRPVMRWPDRSVCDRQQVFVP